MKRRILFDTNAYIDYGETLPESGFLSAVVVQEMTAGAADDSRIKQWQQNYRSFEERGKLLVPTIGDWWEAGRILNALWRSKKSVQGRYPGINKDRQDRLVRDALIARTAKLANVAVVTRNVDDFKLLQRFCAVEVISSFDYFGYEP